VRAGRPNLQTAMPRYDLSTQEVLDLARYVHYLRQTGRYADLTAGSLHPGDPEQGEAYFARRCGQCHSVTADLAGITPKYDARELHSQIARPRVFRADEGGDANGRAEHLRLLEQYRCGRA
jgi:mono/diheme cytochrome c family protein